MTERSYSNCPHTVTDLDFLIPSFHNQLSKTQQGTGRWRGKGGRTDDVEFKTKIATGTRARKTEKKIGKRQRKKERRKERKEENRNPKESKQASK